jgi:hypothetical protein
MLKDVEGYEMLYAVSDCGKVFSYKRGRYLKPGTDKEGYLLVALFKNNERKTSKVHRLVAETFLEADNQRNQVDHIDGNKTNNNISNLRWVTHSENNQNKRTTKGYTFYRRFNKWLAQICVNKKPIFLGYHDNEEEARQAYLDAKKIYHPSAPEME